MRRPNVVVIGSSNTDLVVRASHLPSPGETVMASSLTAVQGGKGANQAVSAARLGAGVVFVARVGKDGYGDAALSAFKADGIDISYVVQDIEQPTGVAIIGVDEASGENSILVVPGANGLLSVEDIERASPAIKTADVVVCQLEVPLKSIEAALRIAHDAGVMTILNPSPYQPLNSELLSCVSVLVLNEGEAELLTGRKFPTPEGAGIAIRDSGVRTILITLGKHGSMLINGEGVVQFPGVAVSHVVDTTGAGDCFTGALAVALAEKQSLQSAIRFASIAAAISVTRVGAQPSLPTRQEVDTRK